VGVSKLKAHAICELIADAAEHGRLLHKDGHTYWIKKKGSPSVVTKLNHYAGLLEECDAGTSATILTTYKAHSSSDTGRAYRATARIILMRAGPS
jgi:hypothetical protein